MENERGRRRPRRRRSKKKVSKEEEERYIPEEIIRIILLKLPVESLLRFRFVSQQWCSWISPNIKQKVVFPYRSERCRMVERCNDVCCCPPQHCRHFRSIGHPTLSSSSHHQLEELVVAVGKNIDTTHCKVNVHICGSCNGLLLVKVGVYLLLWDPSDCSRKGLLCCQRLRNYRCESKEKNSWECESYDNVNKRCPRVHLGLCFDSDKNEYKALLALSLEEEGSDRSQVLVGSFGNKTWKHVTLLFGIRFIKASPSLVLNGILHWLVCDEERGCKRVLCFDPKTDQFVDDLPLPPPPDSNKRLWGVIGMGALDGCMCISRRNSSQTTVEVSVMKEYGVGESWTELLRYKREYCGPWLVPLFFTDERKRRVLMQRRNEIVAYDMDSDVFTDIADTNNENNDFTVVYEETLKEEAVVEEATPSKQQKQQQVVWQVIGKSELKKDIDVLAATPQILPWNEP